MTILKDKHSKFRAKSRLLTELELVSGKELAKAQSVDEADAPDLRLAPPEPDYPLLPALVEEEEQRIRRGVIMRPGF